MAGSSGCCPRGPGRWDGSGRFPQGSVLRVDLGCLYLLMKVASSPPRAQRAALQCHANRCALLVQAGVINTLTPAAPDLVKPLPTTTFGARCVPVPAAPACDGQCFVQAAPCRKGVRGFGEQSSLLTSRQAITMTRIPSPCNTSALSTTFTPQPLGTCVALRSPLVYHILPSHLPPRNAPGTPDLLNSTLAPLLSPTS